MFKVYYTVTEKDGKKYKNYYLALTKADGREVLIPISVKFFNPSTYRKDMQYLEMVAQKYEKQS